MLTERYFCLVWVLSVWARLGMLVYSAAAPSKYALHLMPYRALPHNLSEFIFLRGTPTDAGNAPLLGSRSRRDTTGPDSVAD